MEIFQEQVQSSTQSNLQISIIKLVGDIDASNYSQVIKTAEEACASGARYLLIDLSGVNFMSSSGLLALHRIAVVMRKANMPKQDDSWTSLEDMKKAAGETTGPEKYVKLLNPQPRVQKSLEQVDYQRVFEVFTDREAALASFH